MLEPAAGTRRADPSAARPVADFDALAGALESRHEALAGGVAAELDRKHPGLGEASRRGITDLIGEGLRAQLQGFRRDAPPECCPEIDGAALAALAATRPGLPVLLDAYRLCRLALWQAWFCLVEDSDLDGEDCRLLLARGSDFFFGYADLLSGHVVEAYRRQAWAAGAGGSEGRRLRAIEGVLAGDPLAASWLDYDLERHHLGLIAWGEDPVGTVRELARSLGRPFLAVDPEQGDRCCWAWVSGVRPLDPTEGRALRAFTPSAERIALGFEGFGEAGFCASHRQASRARRFAPPAVPPVVLYEDFVVQSLACENEQEARAFIARELSGIDDESPTSKRLRETLVAYFEAEYNATATGAMLGIHHQTVAQRLRTAEERLGRVELDVALRLRAILHGTPQT